MENRGCLNSNTVNYDVAIYIDLSPKPPYIITQPVDRTVVVGGNTTVNVTAGGEAPLSYEWEYSIGDSGWQPIPDGGVASGVKTDTLSMKNIGKEFNNGLCRCKVTNSVGLVYSNEVRLTVEGTTPVNTQIKQQPVNRSIFSGQSIMVP